MIEGAPQTGLEVAQRNAEGAATEWRATVAEIPNAWHLLSPESRQGWRNDLEMKWLALEQTRARLVEALEREGEDRSPEPDRPCS
jgi:hypothetical protein